MNRLRRMLSDSRVPLAAAGLALVLTLPAIGNRWYFDDLPQRLILLQHPLAGAPPAAMFTFLDGDPDHTRPFIELGTLPWWTDPEIRASFWRPITVWSHRLDYVLWPESAAFQHLHSLLWLAALVWIAARIYRRLLGATWAAGLAALLYALDDAHGFPAGWLANRNALVATAFGLLALWVHDRWRRGGWRAGAWLGPGAFAAALLSGEFGLGAGAYLAAHALVLDPRRGARRLLPLAPYAAVFIAWAVYYGAAGHGASGSGLYVDPVRHPAHFAMSVIERAPILLLGQWGMPYADVYSGLGAQEAARMWGLAIAVMLALAVVLIPLLRRDRVAEFLGLGMLFSLLPVCATFPANRLLFFTGIGAMGLTARLVTGLIDRDAAVPRAKPWRWAAWALAGALLPLQLLLAPLQLAIGSTLAKVTGTVTNAAMASVPRDPALLAQDLVIVNAPDHLFFVSHIGVAALLGGRPLPRHLRALVPAPVATTFTRLDEFTLRADVPDGVLSGIVGTLFRGPERPMRAGDVVRLEGLEIEVLEVSPERGPSAVVFRFGVPLEDPALRWVRWEDGRYVPFTPPAPGERVRLPAPRGPMEMSGVDEMMEAYRKAQTPIERSGGSP